MLDSEDEGVINRNLSRRSVLKWGGALAAAGIVGIGLGFGGDLLIRPSTTKTVTSTRSGSTGTLTVTTTTTPPPPTTLSYVPPLSPQVQSTVDSLVSQLQSVHAGDTITYGDCQINGCWGCCAIKVHTKNGIVTAIEPDDTIHPNVAVEDTVVSSDEITQQMLQLRGCPKGYMWRAELYSPQYIQYPMQQIGQKGPNAQFVRISWDQALQTIADQMTLMKEKYGPLSIAMLRPIGGMMPYSGQYLGVGYQCWGEQSCPAYKGAGGDQTWGAYEGPSSPSMPNLLQSKLIVLWGWDPFINEHEYVYYLTLAKKQGIPIIAIDPQLNWSAQALADQWIPIRPGTDSAFLVAIAEVLFTENLYDQDFVNQWVEPTGFAKWKDYVLGNTAGPDGAIDRTPEWAAPICGVPADTIRAFAELYASSKPVWLKVHWSIFRNLTGYNDSRLGIYLQAMTGNVGIPGAFGGGASDNAPQFLPDIGMGVYGPPLNTGSTTPPYNPPYLCNSNTDAASFVLHKQLEAGEITLAEYNAAIGNPNPDIGTPNPHMWMNFTTVFYYSGFDPAQNTYDVNERLQVLAESDFVAITARMVNEVMVRYADIVLPVTIQFFNEYSFPDSGESWGNVVFLSPKVVNPTGEAQSEIWIETHLAAQLGLQDQVNPKLQNVADEDWDATIEPLYQQGYEAWASNAAVTAVLPNPPTWEEFKAVGVIRVPRTYQWVSAQDMIVMKTVPIPTASGKIEFYSNAIATGPGPNGLMLTSWEGPINLGNGLLPPMFEYQPAPTYGFFGSKATQYPLMLITPHSFYRHHSGHDLNSITNDEFRHSCWINPADASARGINDNDLVHVFSDAGEMVLPAYVTSRITPGVVIVRFGGWCQPSSMITALSPNGLDLRGAPNIVIPDDSDGMPIGIDWATTLVQVEEFNSVPPQTVTTTVSSTTTSSGST